MNLNSFCFIISMVLSYAVFSQDISPGWNDYKTHSQLTWKDFIGNKPELYPDSSAAEVDMNLDFKWGYQTEGIEIQFLYEVYALQNPFASWVDPRHKRDDVLAHEQLHFDITELHARILRKRLSEFDYINTRNLRRQVNRMYEQVKITWKSMEKEYDKETNHGILTEQQSLWVEKVALLLEKYSQFKS